MRKFENLQYGDEAVIKASLDALADKGIETLSADVGMVPDAYTPVDKDTAAKVQRLIDRLEDNDDVQNVYHTAEYPDDFEPED